MSESMQFTVLEQNYAKESVSEISLEVGPNKITEPNLVSQNQKTKKPGKVATQPAYKKTL